MLIVVLRVPMLPVFGRYHIKAVMIATNNNMHSPATNVILGIILRLSPPVARNTIN
jgi:hypothetical protein